jgi:hypothetical protein
MIRIFRVFVPNTVLALLLSETTLIFGAYILAVYLDRDLLLEPFLFGESGLSRIIMVAAFILLGL